MMKQYIGLGLIAIGVLWLVVLLVGLWRMRDGDGKARDVVVDIVCSLIVIVMVAYAFRLTWVVVFRDRDGEANPTSIVLEAYDDDPYAGLIVNACDPATDALMTISRGEMASYVITIGPVTIATNGTVTIEEGVTMDEASREFWMKVQALAQEGW